MKHIKRVVPFVIAAVMLNFLFYFTLTVGGYAHIYDRALAGFSEPCDIRDDDFSEFDLLEDSLRRDSLFYFEVKEGYAVTLDFMMNTAKYLSREIGAKYIVGEFGYAAAKYLNRCVSGETDALSVLREHMTGDMRTDEFLAFVDGIRDYNARLDERQMLEFVGIGVGEKEFTAVYIDSLYEKVADKLQNADVKTLFASDLRENDADAYFSAIRDDHAEDSLPYRELFSDKYNDFRIALGEYFADATKSADYMTTRLIDEYNRSVGGKFMVYVTDTSLYESIRTRNAVIFDRISLGHLIYADDYSFGIDSELSDFYTVDDRFMGIFEGWRSVVHRIAGRRFDGYRFTERENPPLIFFAADLTPTNALDEPIGADISEDVINEDNDNT